MRDGNGCSLHQARLFRHRRLDSQNIREGSAKMNPDELIQWLLDNKLMKTRFDQFLNEQLVEITDFGKEINTILSKLKETSKEAQATNEQVAETLEESET